MTDLAFIAGTFVGAFCGIAVMALLAVTKRAEVPQTEQEKHMDERI